MRSVKFLYLYILILFFSLLPVLNATTEADEIMVASQPLRTLVPLPFEKKDLQKDSLVNILSQLSSLEEVQKMRAVCKDWKAAAEKVFENLNSNLAIDLRKLSNPRISAFFAPETLIATNCLSRALRICFGCYPHPQYRPSNDHILRQVRELTFTTAQLPTVSKFVSELPSLKAITILPTKHQKHVNDDEDFIPLLEALPQDLETLSLPRIKFNYHDGALNLFQRLIRFSKLSSLNLNFTESRLSRHDLRYLSRVLKTLTALNFLSLDISNNGLYQRALNNLSSFLKGHQKLTRLSLNIRGNHFIPQTDALSSALGSISNLAQLTLRSGGTFSSLAYDIQIVRELKMLRALRNLTLDLAYYNDRRIGDLTTLGQELAAFQGLSSLSIRLFDGYIYLSEIRDLLSSVSLVSSLNRTSLHFSGFGIIQDVDCSTIAIPLNVNVTIEQHSL